ncbi:hypothetical protein C8R45DRAFT_927602 [Mycena sanguinolenta]|nr:hypothetical protein C8R45DRAFT_927602 [Mycena sanguinolenta]
MHTRDGMKVTTVGKSFTGRKKVAGLRQCFISGSAFGPPYEDDVLERHKTSRTIRTNEDPNADDEPAALGEDETLGRTNEPDTDNEAAVPQEDDTSSTNSSSEFSKELPEFDDEDDEEHSRLKNNSASVAPLAIAALNSSCWPEESTEADPRTLPLNFLRDKYTFKTRNCACGRKRTGFLDIPPPKISGGSSKGVAAGLPKWNFRRISEDCDCGRPVTNDQKNKNLSIECKGIGCETRWFHLECVKLDSASQIGSVMLVLPNVAGGREEVF